MLAYRLDDLFDRRQRDALFSDLIAAGAGIPAADLPAFLSALSTALDDWDTQSETLDRLGAALDHASEESPAIDNLRDILRAYTGA